MCVCARARVGVCWSWGGRRRSHCCELRVLKPMAFLCTAQGRIQGDGVTDNTRLPTAMPDIHFKGELWMFSVPPPPSLPTYPPTQQFF